MEIILFLLSFTIPRQVVFQVVQFHMLHEKLEPNPGDQPTVRVPLTTVTL